MNALCSHRRDTCISLFIISCHAITLKILEHSKNVKEYPFYNDFTKEFSRYEYHRERLKYNGGIGDQMPCRKEEMWKPVFEAWYNVAPNVLEELKNSMPRRITDLIQAKRDTK